MNLNFDFDARSSTFSACALQCYTDISIRFTLCNKETKERVYKIGKGTAKSIISLLKTWLEDYSDRSYYNNNDTQEYNITGVWYGYVFKKVTW